MHIAREFKEQMSSSQPSLSLSLSLTYPLVTTIVSPSSYSYSANYSSNTTMVSMVTTRVRRSHYWPSDIFFLTDCSLRNYHFSLRFLSHPFCFISFCLFSSSPTHSPSLKGQMSSMLERVREKLKGRGGCQESVEASMSFFKHLTILI